MPAGLDFLPFHVDHVIAKQHRGQTVEGNLAFCCSHCNAHKGPNVAGIDPRTGRVVALFNPRSDEWATHFAWSGAELIGLTPKGRATVLVLAVNLEDRLAAREALMNEGVFGEE
jgi:hypothetical protein